DEARVNALAGKISVRFIGLSAAILAAYRSKFTILSIDRPGPGRVMPTPLIDPQPLEIAVALPTGRRPARPGRSCRTGLRGPCLSRPGTVWRAFDRFALPPGQNRNERGQNREKGNNAALFTATCGGRSRNKAQVVSVQAAGRWSCRQTASSC